MRKFIVAVCCVAVTALSLFVSCSKSEAVSDEKEITIGIVAPLSGNVAVYGTEALNGIKLAVQEINAAGGWNGKQIKLIIEDDEGNPEKSVNVYKKLTAKDGVRMIIGSLTSGCVQAMTGLAQMQKVLVIAPAATMPSITDAGDFIFRMCFIDPFQGRVMGEYAKKNLGFNTAAVLYDPGSDYSSGLYESFTKAFEQSGGKIVAAESYAGGDKDFNAQLTKIKSTNPECIYLPDYYATVMLIAKQLRAQGITAQLLGGDGWAGIQEYAGEELEGAYFSDHYIADSKDPAVVKFVSVYRDAYKQTPTAFAVLGYDSVYLLGDAIKKTNSTDPSVLKDTLATMEGQYVTGKLRFDSKRNPIKAMVVVGLTKNAEGKVATVYKDTVNP
ncbi:amino acid ABC transporter substrate-binding protein [Treponema phagedenis]|nr:ABC transporter substrate-binding protein [Treponema phagedenis]EFW36548.1 receptor family ligand-binding protein [Treponema phagedenis F0421]NVP23325.1 ABC transporter substrate-binding protein [Treponema phagedenis]QEJ96494.1 ABC transporter substrate-binding protein [Treponema phagedenis]QEJ99643.1 ABC transporter substrate-binding protein [Treponema phagedenis]QEK02276.1 ABC transporter substrate-binding protein [Treponema phagedenis]